MTPIAVDTGPIVALLSKKDRHHAWAVETFSSLRAPVISCEAVLTEASFLLGRFADNPAAPIGLLVNNVVRIEFELADEAPAIRALMNRYASVPMSLADASLVRMAELEPRLAIMTLDGDFDIYRRSGRHALQLLRPGN